MWFISVEVEQETSAPLLKKILDPPLLPDQSGAARVHSYNFLCSIPLYTATNNIFSKAKITQTLSIFTKRLKKQTCTAALCKLYGIRYYMCKQEPTFASMYIWQAFQCKI